MDSGEGGESRDAFKFAIWTRIDENLAILSAGRSLINVMVMRWTLGGCCG